VRNRRTVRTRRAGRRAAACSAAILLAACIAPRVPAHPVTVAGDGAITIASFDFPQSAILAELYGQALEAKGYHVKRATDLGPRELIEPALEKDLVEFVPEYQGTLLDFVTGEASLATSNVQATNADLAAVLAPRGVTALSPAPAQDANAFAVTAATAIRYGLTALSDLSPIASTLVLGGPPECRVRPLCLPGLERTYGLHFKRFVRLDTSGPLTVASLSSGQVDVGLLFTTDPAVTSRGFVLLSDDRGLQPADNVTPVVRTDVVRQYGDAFVQLVNSISARLTTSDLTVLNLAVSQGARTPSSAARGWLVTHGFLG